MRRINEAEGHAQEILRVAEATAQGIRSIAQALQEPGGEDAMSLRIAEQWIAEFGKLAKSSNTMIIPTDIADITGTVAGLAKVLRSTGGAGEKTWSLES